MVPEGPAKKEAQPLGASGLGLPARRGFVGSGPLGRAGCGGQK